MTEAELEKKWENTVWDTDIYLDDIDEGGGRMTEYVKIKCDGCKFCEECVDYGWQGCRKFTPKPTEPMTNEEYIRSLNTEQLAEFVIKAMLFYDNAGITVLEAIKNAVEDNEKLGSYFMESVVEWLKQPHKGE